MPIPIPTIAAVRAAIAGFWPTMRLILFIAAIAFGAVQTVRLEGFRFWPLSIEGALPKVARLETDLANVREAQALAEQEAARQRIFWENHYRNLAKETDLANATQTQPRAADDADRFIAANRVQPCPAGGARGGPGTAPGGDRAQGADRPGDVPGGDDGSAVQPVNAEQLLFVSPAFVRTCYGNTGRLLDARDWALALERESAAAVEGASAPP